MKDEAAARTAVEVRAEGGVGTACLSGPCILCGRTFDIRTGQARLVARDRAGTHRGLVCPWCACAGEDGPKERLLARARRARREATALEEMVEGGVRIHPSARDAATVAQTGRKGEL
jgi:hypothetical protein